MKKLLIFSLFALLAAGLFTACSKNSSSPAPTSPIVGEFDINRVEFTDFPSSYTIYNSVVTSATALGTDTYIFNNDNTFTNNYTLTNATGATTNNTQTGTYAYVTTTQVVTLTPTSQNGQAVQPYALLYSTTANELSTGKIARQDSIPNPTTGKKQLVTYSSNYIYKKK